MAKIEPFRGLHYSKEKVHDISQVVTPPYDVIDPKMREEFLRRHPLNIVRLILPEDAEAARETLISWLKEGVFEKEEYPSIYPLKQVFSLRGMTYQRWGFVALVRLEEEILQGHERTMDHVVEERLRLLKKTGIQPGEIFSLYSDPKGEVEAILQDVEGSEPRFQLTDDEGTVHKLWALKDQGAISLIQKHLSSQKLLIADGHHRLKTAMILRQLKGGEAFGYVCMYLTRMESPGLLILPVHRVLYELPKTGRDLLEERIKEFFEVEVTSLEGLLQALEGRRGIGMVDGKGEAWILLPKDQLPAPLPLRDVDSFLVDELILKGVEGKVEFLKDEAKALQMLKGGRADMAFLLRPVAPETLKRVVERGEVMPKKSTYFYPKVPTGLVLYQVFEVSGEDLP